MDSNIVLMSLQDKISSEGAPLLKSKLDKLSPQQMEDFNVKLPFLNLKNPIIWLILGIFLGTLGVDRFYKGDMGLGVAKLFLWWLTLGLWIWLDFFVWKGIKKDNLNKVLKVL
ncbi:MULTISPECIES: NINE protein [unclassified Campylobacter]|uniref:NINE protein n=1 Tax=unclassified Campylobacter TaxID=2593542 RepID=UPI001237A439